MKILILGGTGYVGSVLFQQLKQEHEVSSIDLEWFGNPSTKPNLILDYNNFNNYSSFDVIILLAAHSSVKMALNNQTSALRNNVSNVINLLPKLSKEQKLIIASSSSCYGGLNKLNCNEDEQGFSIVNPYDLSKIFLDEYLKLSDAHYYSLRFGTVNGASSNFRTEIMINSFVNTAIDSGLINVFNGQIHRPVLGLNRDLVNSIKCIIEQGEYDKRGIYNLASFNGTVNDIATEVADELDIPINLIEKEGHLYDFTISTEKFTKTFGYNFVETPGSIAREIIDNWDDMVKGNRDKAIIY